MGAIISDEKIRQMAEEVGFYGVNIWWIDNIPRFRQLIEMAKKSEEIADTPKRFKFIDGSWKFE